MVSVLGIVFFLVILEFFLYIIGFTVALRVSNSDQTKLSNSLPCRIVCFGDSMTYGQYPLKLQQLLDTQYGSGKYQIIDKGLLCTDSGYICSIVSETLDQYHPQFIILMTGQNDRTEKNNYFISNKDHTSKTEWWKRLKLFKLALLLREEISYDISSAGVLRNVTTLGKSNRDMVRMASPGESLYQTDLAEGRKQMAEDKFEQAESLFRKAIECNPSTDDESAINSLIWLHKVRGSLNIEELNIEFGERYPRIFIPLMGNQYEINKDLKNAEQCYERGVRLFPGTRGLENELLTFYRRYHYSNKIYAFLRNNRRLIGAMAVFRLERDGTVAAQPFFDALTRQIKENQPLWTSENIRFIIGEARKRQVRVICMQYPMRKVQALKDMLPGYDDIVYVDNEESYKSIVSREGYDAVFVDQFAGDFGHCNDRGEKLMASNIFAAIEPILPPHQQ
ncbi:MAG: hypothetical protein NTU66_07860 [Elusimicrobia bacterium]|nr:hypothetical protein [Elusimicrobiota bacterium]